MVEDAPAGCDHLALVPHTQTRTGRRRILQTPENKAATFSLLALGSVATGEPDVASKRLV